MQSSIGEDIFRDVIVTLVLPQNSRHYNRLAAVLPGEGGIIQGRLETLEPCEMVTVYMAQETGQGCSLVSDCTEVIDWDDQHVANATQRSNSPRTSGNSSMTPRNVDMIATQPTNSWGPCLVHFQEVFFMQFVLE